VQDYPPFKNPLATLPTTAKPRQSLPPMSFDNLTQPAPDSPQAAGTTTYLVAGPPSASPPLFIAVALVALSIAGPFIFVAYGTPSLLLGITALAVALAGMLTMLAAIRAQLRRRADAASRRRVSISQAGITLHPTLSTADDLHFLWENIDNAYLMPAAFIVHAGHSAPKPGRYAVRFGKLMTPRADIISALDFKAGIV
jgi:hypothetical protein